MPFQIQPIGATQGNNIAEMYLKGLAVQQRNRQFDQQQAQAQQSIDLRSKALDETIRSNNLINERAQKKAETDQAQLEADKAQSAELARIYGEITGDKEAAKALAGASTQGISAAIRLAEMDKQIDKEANDKQKEEWKEKKKELWALANAGELTEDDLDSDLARKFADQFLDKEGKKYTVPDGLKPFARKEAGLGTTTVTESKKTTNDVKLAASFVEQDETLKELGEDERKIAAQEIASLAITLKNSGMDEPAAFREAIKQYKQESVGEESSFFGLSTTPTLNLGSEAPPAQVQQASGVIGGKSIGKFKNVEVIE